MEIRRDPGCVQYLLWRCTPTQEIEAEELCERIGSALLRAGFLDCSQEIFLLVYKEPKHHHQILLVPRTGRIQLRVHYLIPPLERPMVAYSLACQLADILHEAHPPLETFREYCGC